MTSPSYSVTIAENLARLAWSHWTELGVAGVVRNHQATAIDPEALILLTAHLGDREPRLRDESIDWCVKNRDAVAVTRLKNLAKQGICDLERFAAYAKAVNTHGPARWPIPADVEPLAVRLSGKSRSPDLSRPSLTRLRLRALFGVGARAEIVAELLSGSGADRSAAELSRAGYSKRHIAQTCDELVDAGLLRRIEVGNQHRYRLNKPRELQSIFSVDWPVYVPRWTDTIEILIKLHELATTGAAQTDGLAAVSTQRRLRELRRPLSSVGWTPPVPATPTDLWHTAMTWAVDKSSQCADGPPDQDDISWVNPF